MNRILDDLKVVELSSVLAGPLVGSFLAELGASVTKIESPAGDVTRQWRSEKEIHDHNASAYFCSANFGKKHLRLNLKEEADYNQLIALIEDADVLISNYLPRVAEKLKVRYDDLKEYNPDLIYCELRGFIGQRARPAYDAVTQAETGWMSMNGTNESGPLKMPVAIMDTFAAHHMKQAVLIGIIQKMKTGKGCHIICTLQGSSISNLVNQATNYLMSGMVAGLDGSEHPNIAPYGEVYRCLDGKHVILAVGTDKQFCSLCEVLDLNHLKEDPRFISNTQRVEHREELDELLEEAIEKMQSTDLDEQARANRIPIGVVRNLQEVLQDEAIAEFIIEDDNGIRISNLPFKIL